MSLESELKQENFFMRFIHSKWFYLGVGLLSAMLLPTIYNSYKITHFGLYLFASLCAVGGAIIGTYKFFDIFLKERNQDKEIDFQK